MKKRLAILGLILIIAACAWTQLTPRQRYAKAVDTVDAMMDSYRSEYALQTPQEQAIWNRDLAPHLLELVISLRDWELALSDATKEQAYLNLKARVRKELISAGILLMQED